MSLCRTRMGRLLALGLGAGAWESGQTEELCPSPAVLSEMRSWFTRMPCLVTRYDTLGMTPSCLWSQKLLCGWGHTPVQRLSQATVPRPPGGVWLAAQSRPAARSPRGPHETAASAAWPWRCPEGEAEGLWGPPVFGGGFKEQVVGSEEGMGWNLAHPLAPSLKDDLQTGSEGRVFKANFPMWRRKVTVGPFSCGHSLQPVWTGGHVSRPGEEASLKPSPAQPQSGMRVL